MTTKQAYRPKFMRAGQVLGRKDAVRLIVSGCAVTVAVPDEDLMGMGDLRVTITVGSDPAGDPAACAMLPATARLAADDLEVYAAVMAAAASLCTDANSALNRQ